MFLNAPRGFSNERANPERVEDRGFHKTYKVHFSSIRQDHNEQREVTLRNNIILQVLLITEGQ